MYADPADEMCAQQLCKPLRHWMEQLPTAILLLQFVLDLQTFVAVQLLYSSFHI